MRVLRQSSRTENLFFVDVVHSVIAPRFQCSEVLEFSGSLVPRRPVASAPRGRQRLHETKDSTGGIINSAENRAPQNNGQIGRAKWSSVMVKYLSCEGTIEGASIRKHDSFLDQIGRFGILAAAVWSVWFSATRSRTPAWL